MEAWSIFFFSLFLCLLLKILISSLSRPSPRIPPAPFTIPIIGNFLWLLKPISELEQNVRDLHSKYGPIVTLRLGPQLAIFVSSHALAYQALVQNGAVFGSRPQALALDRIYTNNQRSITSAVYGPTWRVLRRNLTSEILHPSRVKSYSHAREWVLEALTSRLKSESQSGDAVRVIDHFQYTMFSLLALMCFGDKLEEKQIKQIEDAQRAWLLSVNRFDILNFWPRVGKILFRKRWEEFYRIRGRQAKVLLPLIRARKKLMEKSFRKNHEDDNPEGFVLSYVDTLLDLELPYEKRKLNDSEMMTLCSEFLDAGTDTTATALQWIMANFVKYPDIQKKLFEEIRGVAGSEAQEVKENDLQKMSYLKAVVLEGLRRHSPAHLVLPHAVTEDTELGGYTIPKDSYINFMVAAMGMDPEVWEDPMEFKPERFMNKNENGGAVFDITGSREIKMMPFGAGRRICPGLSLAMLHLEYFVANLVWRFEWLADDGDGVDLSEKEEFTFVMKNPLRARLNPRAL